MLNNLEKLTEDEKNDEVIFDDLYNTLPKQHKKYVKQLKKKALRTNKDKNHLYKVLMEESKRIVADNKILYPNVKEWVQELTQNLTKMNLKK